MFDAVSGASLLTALADLGVKDWLAPAHYLVRLVHILSMAAFFGGILLLDLRLLGIRTALSFQAISGYVLPYVIGALGVALMTGVLLFLYDPVAVAARPYFAPKMVLIGLAVLNAMAFQALGHKKAASSRRLPGVARGAGAVSLALWFGVVVCACFNKLGPLASPSASAQIAAQKTIMPVTIRDKRDAR
jgi:hypothetical protein